MHQATKQHPICNGHFIGPKLQDGGHPDPGLCALVLDVSSGLGQVVRFGGDLSPTLLGPGKRIEQIVREDRYRVAKPSISILPAQSVIAMISSTKLLLFPPKCQKEFISYTYPFGSKRYFWDPLDTIVDFTRGYLSSLALDGSGLKDGRRESGLRTGF